VSIVIFKHIHSVALIPFCSNSIVVSRDHICVSPVLQCTATWLFYWYTDLTEHSLNPDSLDLHSKQCAQLVTSTYTWYHILHTSTVLILYKWAHILNIYYNLSFLYFRAYLL
jgi:hypothetical protein